MQTEEDVLNFHASTTFGKVFLAGEYIEVNRKCCCGDLMHT